MKTSFSINCFIAILAVTIFFYPMIGNGYILLILSFIPVIPKLLSRKKIETKFSLIWFLFLLTALMSTNFSLSKDASNKFMFLIVCYFLIKLILDNEDGWQRIFSKLVYALSFLSVITTLMSYILPDFILSIVKSLYSDEALDMYMNLFNNGSYAGIHGQTSITGFFISIFIAFLVSRLSNNEKKSTTYFLIILGIIALFMTKKRSFLIANTISILVIFWRNISFAKTKGRNTISFILLAVIIIVAFRYLPAAKELFEKINTLEDIGDISNGRFLSWGYTIDIWKKNPIWGIGAGSLIDSYDFASHNVYLQVLAEMGIIGFIAYLALILTTLKKSLKKYKILINSDILEIRDKVNCGVSIYVQVLFIIYSFFGNPLYGISFMLPYVIFASLLDAYSITDKKNSHGGIDDNVENRNNYISQHP